MDFPGSSAGKESTCNAGDVGLIPGLGRLWRRGWLPTSVFLPGKLHGEKSLVGYSPWGCKKWDMTEQLKTHTHTHTHTHTNLHDLTDSCHLIPFSSLLNMYSRHTDFLSLFLWNKENFVLLQCLCPCYVFFLGYCCTFHSSQNSGYNTLKIIVQSPTILLSRPHLNTSFFFFLFYCLCQNCN